MPYSPNSDFSEPSGDEKLWRYLDLAKYLNMLTTGTMWFSRTDQLGDPFEGSSTRLSKMDYEEFIRSMVPDGGEANARREALLRKDTDLTNFFRTHLYVNSWHLSDVESEAMWRLYSQDYGIAIVSTLDRVKNHMHSNEDFFGGKVEYINYETERMPTKNYFRKYFHKRSSFAHEREFRLLIIYDTESLGNVMIPWPTFEEFCALTPTGLSVPSDLNQLISVVHIAPTAPDWFFESIQEMTKRLGYGFEVKRSSLISGPIF